MKRLEREWGIYSSLIPTSASATQVRETKRAFYGGAQTLLAIIMKALDPGTEPTDADLRMMDELHQELQDFVAEIKAGRA